MQVLETFLLFTAVLAALLLVFLTEEPMSLRPPPEESKPLPAPLRQYQPSPAIWNVNSFFRSLRLAQPS